MKIQILNKEGKKVSEKETKLFEEPIREDVIIKVVETEKLWQPWSSKFRAGMDISASGNVTHRRHVWKTDRGRGLSRIPRKIFSRRGTQFSWEGAIVPSTKGGRRAHPPKAKINLKKINKRELKMALLSALSYVGNVEEVKKKYSSLNGESVGVGLPLVVDFEILRLKSKEFFEVLEKILGEFYSVAVQKKSVRAGIGKMRGRKYKKNAGLLLVVGGGEEFKIMGVDVVRVEDLIVSDLASNGARLVMFSEKAIEELENVLMGDKKVSEKSKKVREDKRKLRKGKRKSTTPKSNPEQNELLSPIKSNKPLQPQSPPTQQGLYGDKKSNLMKDKGSESVNGGVDSDLDDNKNSVEVSENA